MSEPLYLTEARARHFQAMIALREAERAFEEAAAKVAEAEAATINTRAAYNLSIRQATDAGLLPT